MATGGGGGGGERQEMTKELLDAALRGDTKSMKWLYSQDICVLLQLTVQNNNCLHIASTRGHQEFCELVVRLRPSLLTEANKDLETPLLSAVKSGRTSLASFLLGFYLARREFTIYICNKDVDGYNALHHAIGNNHTDLALKLIEAEPALSNSVNNFGESPLFRAVQRDFTGIALKLLEAHDPTHCVHGLNCLDAAVRNGSSVIVKKILDACPQLAKRPDQTISVPICQAVYLNNIDVLQVFLEHKSSFGHVSNKDGFPLLNIAAHGNHVDVARVVLEHCPDAPYRGGPKLFTCLHTAVEKGNAEFVHFILKHESLRKLINMQDTDGNTALHIAVWKRNANIVRALLSHQDIDTTVLNNQRFSAVWLLEDSVDSAKTIPWNEVQILLRRADPKNAASIDNLCAHAKRVVIDASRKDAKTLAQVYTTSTAAVASVMVAITFAALFTLPGGYSSAAGSEGYAIMSRNAAFQAFLFSDILALCSSFVVAFICIISKWEDYEFLIYYVSVTKKLMWVAYVASTTAISTALYTVLAPRLPWLVIAVSVVIAMLPVATWLLGKRPILKFSLFRSRSGQSSKYSLVGMV